LLAVRDSKFREILLTKRDELEYVL
jgi:hypothetical protein